MIIRSIQIENFLSYHERTSFTFDLGPTIIIGQNNTGKSKLFDAFNWALYDRAYKSREEKWDNTKDWKDKLVNNCAKSQCKTNESVTSSVSIVFEDEEENEYLLSRDFTIKKKSDGGWDCDRSSDLSLSKKDPITHNSSDFYDADAEYELKKLFPENLSKYFLFQGESISQIMSLSNKSAFTNALRDLSRIEVFEKAKFYAEKVLKTMKKEFEAKDDSDKALQQRKMELSGEVEKLKDDISILDEQFDNECKERDLRKEQFERKNEELRKYQECARILKDIEYLEKDKDSKTEQRADLIESQKRDVFDKWMYAGSGPILESFLAFYAKNKVEKKIPEPIRQDFIKEMIRDHQCKVCGSDALEGSTQLEKISSFLSDKSLDKEIELINQLSVMADMMRERVGRITDEIEAFYKKSGGIDDQIKVIQSRIKAKNEELRTVIPADVSEDELKTKNFQQIQKDRDNFKIDLDKSEAKINQLKGKREDKIKLLETKQEEYDSLIGMSSNTKERDKFLLAEQISGSTSKFYETFLSRIIQDIEKDANEYFGKMTLKNAALSGKVKVDFTDKEVYTISEDGDRQYNINQANKVSLQIAFVAAVLSVSNKFWNTYFPFIADAPISALGGDNKITAIETMTDIFKQSIIILKDDSVTSDQESVKTDLVRNLIKNHSEVKNAYELSISGDSVTDQHTVYKKLRG